MTTYVLAGGYFWCLDGVYRQIKGVTASISGYAGGDKKDASYYQVASGKTGHAEAVLVTFDETAIPKDVILDIFFLIHDPTTLNRQGADIGPQYRSAMFYQSVEQLAEFDQAIKRAKQVWNDPILTEISPLKAFYEAEPEHQDYFANNPTNPYCSVIITPKITKARQKYAYLFSN